MTGARIKKIITGVPVFIYAVFTLFILLKGIVNWNGGDRAYDSISPDILRGFLMLLSLSFFVFAISFLYKITDKIPADKLRLFSVIAFLLMFSGQLVYVFTAQTGIRYDALKVYDEAVSLFSGNGIGENDLNGYFSIYSNNCAITILTYYTLKLLIKLHIVYADLSNGILALQVINIIYTDLAILGFICLMGNKLGNKEAFFYIVFAMINPMTYVWLPFYYTNTVSMAFGIWGIILLFKGISLAGKDTALCVICSVLSGIIFALGFKLRATVFIALIAAFIVICLSGSYKDIKVIKVKTITLFILIISMAASLICFKAVEKRYLAFEPNDTAVPAVHWVMMGLNPTGSFTPADEAYTMGFEGREAKKEGDMRLLKERAKELGPGGIAKLYMDKLSGTFADGAGGYHSELSLSRDYGILWKYVYGTHRDYILLLTQLFYLASLFMSLYIVINFIRKDISPEAFVIMLFVLGSFFFQMIWEAGTIYSIGIYPYVFALCVLGLNAKKEGEARKEENAGIGKTRFTYGNKLGFFISAAGFIALIAVHLRYPRESVIVSVDQFLFQSNDPIALSDGMEIKQSFVSDKVFSIISLKARNFEGKFNDSVYEVSLKDGNGDLIKTNKIYGKDMTDYEFTTMDFENVPGVTDYEISIKKISGENDLIFLYYDTGHTDVYPKGKMTGITGSDTADLTFEVYDKEEPGE